MPSYAGPGKAIGRCKCRRMSRKRVSDSAFRYPCRTKKSSKTLQETRPSVLLLFDLAAQDNKKGRTGLTARSWA